MSDLDAAGRVVARARRRLAARRGVELAATGGLIGALAALGAGCALRLVFAVPVSALWIVAPVAGAILGFLWSGMHPPGAAYAALAVDRAAGTDEAFVSALTAEDADRSLRELAAAFALRGLRGRSLASLLPFGMPRRAAPAIVAAAVVAAFAVAGRAASGPVLADGARSAASAARVTAGGAGGATTSGPPGAGAASPAHSSVATPFAGAHTGSATPAAAGPPSALSDDELAELARDLAARGVEAGAEAAQALQRGDRAAAEALLQGALASGVASSLGGGDGGVTLPAGNRLTRPFAPGAWSAGAWPLRYDREVRAWLRRQAASDSGDGARTETR